MLCRSPRSFVAFTLPSTPSSASPTLQTGISLVGVIERKCVNGYIVSVNLGSEKLTGILYHIPSMPQSSCSSDTSAK
ncbi:High mobility group B protein 10-like protein [Drosera capensis]